MRATNHHGRGNAKHAGREFDTRKAKHIDPAKASENLYWTWDGEGSFQQSELAFYRETFQASLDAQNARHMERRQLARVKSMEQFYGSRNYQPEGSLLYIGSMEDGKGQVSREALWECAQEYRAWEEAQSQERGGFYKPLTMALHCDEKGQIHVEERGVYMYRDKDGNMAIGQNAALEAASFELPEPGQAVGKFNNRKMTWDAARREKWLDICEEHGFHIERQPRPRGPGQKHVDLETWQEQQDAQKAQAAARRAERQASQREQAAVAQLREAWNEKQEAARAKETAGEQRAGTEAWAAEQKRLLEAEADRIAAVQGVITYMKATSSRQPGMSFYEQVLANAKNKGFVERNRPKVAQPPLDPVAEAKKAADQVTDKEKQPGNNGLSL